MKKKIITYSITSIICLILLVSTATLLAPEAGSQGQPPLTCYETYESDLIACSDQTDELYDDCDAIFDDCTDHWWCHLPFSLCFFQCASDMKMCYKSVEDTKKQCVCSVTHTYFTCRGITPPETVAQCIQYWPIVVTPPPPQSVPKPKPSTA